MSTYFAVPLSPGVTVSTAGRGLRATPAGRPQRPLRRVDEPGLRPLPRGGYSTAAHVLPSTDPHGDSLQIESVPLAVTKAEQARLIAATLDRIANLHRQTFGMPHKPVAPVPRLPPLQRLIDAAEVDELSRVSIFQRSDRNRAQRRARERAVEQASSLRLQAQIEMEDVQAEIDARWRLLHANDPETVLATLAAAFEGNEDPVAALGVARSEVSLVVLVPGPDAVPDRRPTVTDAGNLALPKMSRAESNGWYRTLVAGLVIAAAKEAFAVAPALMSARVVAVRDGAARDGAADVPVDPQPLLCSRISRQRLRQVRFASTAAWETLAEAGADSVMTLRGSARELAPMDLTHEPDVHRVVEAFHARDRLAS